MGSKWKYKPLNQDEKEEEESVLIDNYQLNNQRNPFNNLENKELLNNKINYELKQRANGSRLDTLTKINKSTKDDSIELIEYLIKPNDSLLSISLNCNCSVEELKRVNKLINDQEFYGLRIIKIPVRKYGLLSEVLIHQLNQTNKSISIKDIKDTLTNNLNNELNESNASSSINLQSDQQLINFNDNELNNFNELNKPINSNSKSSSTNSLIINVGLKKTFDFDRTNGDLNKFLNSLDNDLEKMRNKLNKPVNTILEPLDNDDLFILNNNKKLDKNECDGANCGLNWKTVFFIAILICIIIPLIYLIIYAEEQSVNHHLNHHLNHH